MAITREKKEEVMKKTSEILKSPSAVFVGFSGISGEEAKKMRAEMKEEGVNYSVVKKTIIKKAAEKFDRKGEMPQLDGEVALAYGEDLTAPARLVKNFSKNYNEKIKILGGIFDGDFKSKEQMSEIASIPGMKELRGMFVNIINSPIQRTAVVLGQIAEKKS